MARIFTDGAEFKDTLFWDLGCQANTNMTYVRSGAGSYIVGQGGDKSFSAITELYFRMAYRNYNYTGVVINFKHDTTVLCDMYYNPTTGKFSARVNGSAVATSSGTYSNTDFHLVEIHLKIDDNPNGIFQIKFNGILDIDFSGDTKPGADTTINMISLHSAGGTAGYCDDLALNDTTGGADNSWCGDGHVEILTPVTGGTYAWTGSDGNSVDNYALIDDFPPNNDTDYIKSSTASQQDLHALSDFTGTGKIVTRVWAEARAKDNDATSGQIKIGVNSNGTPSLSAAKTLTGNYARVIGDELTLNPDDSGAWEDADLDALKLLVECE